MDPRHLLPTGPSQASRVRPDGDVAITVRNRGGSTPISSYDVWVMSPETDLAAGLSQPQYAELLVFRTALRRFESWSEQQARRVGLSPAQHQLLLTVKGHADSEGPTIGEVADYLAVRHHSAVGLADRAEAAGLIQRTRHREDGRAVRLRLTELGQNKIRQLSELHLAELRRLAPLLEALIHDHPAGTVCSTSTQPSLDDR